MASSVAGVIEPTLQEAEIRRSSERPTSDLTAYDLYLRALPGGPKTRKPPGAPVSTLLDRRVGPDDPTVLALVTFALGYFGEDIDVAIGLIDHCLTLDPCFAAGWHWTDALRIFAGPTPSRDPEFCDLLAPARVARTGSEFSGATTASLFPAMPYWTARRSERDRAPVARAITPAVMEPATRYRNPELRELFLSGLRLAAGEAS